MWCLEPMFSDLVKHKKLLLISFQDSLNEAEDKKDL